MTDFSGRDPFQSREPDIPPGGSAAGPQGQPPFGPPPGQQPYGPPQGPPPGQPYGPPPGQPPYGPPQGPPQGPPPQGPLGQPPYGPPQGPPPPYGPPPGFPPGPGGFGPYGPPPRKSKTPWIIGGAAVVVAAAVAVILVLTLGGSSSSSSGPKAAVGKLLKADVNKDLSSAQAVTCDPLKSQVDKVLQDPDKSYTIGKSTEKGDSATVAATVVDSQGQSGNVLFLLQKQGGDWKVCDATQGAPGGQSSGNAPGTTVPTDLPSGIPTDLPTGIPTDLPTIGGTGSFCVTPNGQSPICIPN